MLKYFQRIVYLHVPNAHLNMSLISARPYNLQNKSGVKMLMLAFIKQIA